MDKMKVLNLYAGIGGNRKLWENVEVTAVEINPDIAAIYKDFYPKDNVIVGDAHQYLLEHHNEFDFIWSSPPCPTHSKMMNATRHDLIKYPDMALWQEIIFLQYWCKTKYAVENVIPYYKPFLPGQEAGRHLFWSNFKITNLNLPTVKDFVKKGRESRMVNVKKEVLMDYLDIYITKNIYDGSHDERKVLRNCVHPKLGEHVLNCARNYVPPIQEGLFADVKN
jgi:DNA (cytosine-5)-methyltransferase 1